MDELEKRVDGKYYWNPITGKLYTLGYYDGEVGLLGGIEKTQAIYFGAIDGVRIFLQEKDGRILKYTSSADRSARWLGDAGDDEPCFPVIEAVFDGELEDHLEREFALAKIQTYCNELVASTSKPL